MKIIHSIVIPVALAVAGLSQAATLTFTNSNGVGASNAFVDSAGEAFQTTDASISFGFFTSLTDSEVSGSTDSSFVADFNMFGGFVGDFTAAGPPTQSFQGTFASNPAPVLIAGSEYDGKNIYMLVQNKGAEEYMVLKTSVLFSSADDPVLPNVGYTFNQSNISDVLIGGFDNFQTGISKKDLTPASSYNTAVLIPEPSVAILGALGFLGLVRRRR